ncbi:transcription factor HES-3 [Eublepharis macularius]|uniref:Transcription factor HES-3 n=1 Tax=Eublepharis macularius TaxID=481883 RepID=A0AA97KKI0_EUBMA|nr:transcription factor HES-3 [Eublepharis macularius]
MEKKRRARINVSLEQLKALLEKHYSHQIRKRKLEKADILELSVKYMRSLQHSVQGLLPPPPTKSADYQAGFRSCLQGVRQFLVSSEASGAASSFLLLHDFARALPASGAFSTTDSAPEARLAPRWPSPGKAKPAKAPPARGNQAPVPSGAARRQPGNDATSSQRGPGGEVRLWRPW